MSFRSSNVLLNIVDFLGSNLNIRESGYAPNTATCQFKISRVLESGLPFCGETASPCRGNTSELRSDGK